MTSKTSGVDELGVRVTKNWIYATYICCENFMMIRGIYFSYRVQIKRTTEKQTHTHTEKV